MDNAVQAGLLRFFGDLAHELAIDPVETLWRSGHINRVLAATRPDGRHPRNDLLPRAVGLLDRHAVDLIHQGMGDVETHNLVRVLHALADDRG
ncbi:hypothetical protein D3C81_1349890 [compost metagenome]